MGGKRRDKKGRILRNGESQRADGRYTYVYSDSSGKQRFEYSWRLEPTDPLPVGKRQCLSLREKEKTIKKDIDDGISPNGGNLTVLALVEKYVQQKAGVQYNTRAVYKYVINIINKEEFGTKRVDKVRLSDAKGWLIRLQSDGRGYGTIDAVRKVVKPAFQMAVDDDLIRKNPFDFQLSTVVVNNSRTRVALTRNQEKAFLEFIQNDTLYCKYYDAVYILFKTGLRISEFAGLTMGDIDLEARTINVAYQLQRKGNMEYVISGTKTASGTRMLPMTDDVCACFQRVISQRKKPKVEPMIDSRSGFLFLDRNGMPCVSLHWDNYFQHIWAKYNSLCEEGLPKVTPHVCRHTYCSNMSKSGINPKTLQYLMGHADISVTLNTYTHVGFEDAKEDISRISEMVREGGT